MGELLAAEEHEPEVHGVTRGAVGGAVDGEVDHHGERALHVGRTEAVDRLAGDVARQVVLGRNRVEMAGEQDERARTALIDAGDETRVARIAHGDARAPQDAEDVARQRLLVA